MPSPSFIAFPGTLPWARPKMRSSIARRGVVSHHTGPLSGGTGWREISRMAAKTNGASTWQREIIHIAISPFSQLPFFHRPPRWRASPVTPTAHTMLPHPRYISIGRTVAISVVPPRATSPRCVPPLRHPGCSGFSPNLPATVPPYVSTAVHPASMALIISTQHPTFVVLGSPMECGVLRGVTPDTTKKSNDEKRGQCNQHACSRTPCPRHGIIGRQRAITAAMRPGTRRGCWCA